MADRKIRYALVTRFKKLASQKDMVVNINIHIEQWASQSLIDSYGLDTCYDMLDYYFEVSETPDWKWFVNNADKIFKNLTARKEDARIRAMLREQAKDWLGK